MTRPFLVAAAMVFLPLTALADDVTAESGISAVTVYADRASVTRTATVELPEGASAVIFNGLPDSLLADSLRSEGQSAGDVVLGAIESKMVSSAELSAPRERELNDKLQGLQDQRALLVADQQALQQKRQFLSTLSDQANMRTREDIATIDLKPDQWAGAANTLATSVGDTLRAQAANTVQLRQMDEQISAVQRDLAMLQTGARSSYQIRVPVEARAATRLILKVTYQVPNAGWAPIYDARLDTSSAAVKLTQYGEVRQNTGEDWSNVKLTLSTAQPARGAALPMFSPMWVTIYQPQQMGYARREAAFDSAASNVAGAPAMEMQTMAAMPSQVADAAPVMKEATFVAAQLNAGGYVAEYVIPGTSSVLADGTGKKVMIGNLDITSELVVKVKPELDQQAYLVAVTKLAGETPLLPGQASLFRDGAFIGSASLPMLRPGEETDLGFGVDDQVVVKHRVVKDESGESGVISRDNTRLYQTVTEVQNLHRTPVKLVLMQRVPAPQNEQIKLVLDRSFTTAGFDENVNNITGQLRWMQNLQPQQKVPFNLGWTLSWPKDANITGLPF